MYPTDFNTRLKLLLLAVIAGDECQTPQSRVRLARFARLLSREEGMVTWATLVAIMFLCVLAALVFNVGTTINQKIETQNTADSVAYSSAVWMARGMNATTAANHMMGELTALYVLHHALGGEWLDLHYDDENDTSEMRIANTKLLIAYNLARAAATITPVRVPSEVYDAVKTTPCADEESMLYEAKLRLKLMLVQAYKLHLAGALIYPIPFLQAVGQALEGVALAMEWYIYREYRILDGVEYLAGGLRPAKKAIPVVLDGLWGYETTIVATAASTAASSAMPVARRNQCRGAAGISMLPLVKDPVEDVERCQLMRAQTPWMRHWGKTITDFLSNPLWGAPFSGAPHFYVDWCEEYSERIVQWFVADTSESQPDAPKLRDGVTEKGRGYKLYVINGLSDEGEKGREPWTQAGNSAMADDQFCLLGVAQQPKPPRIAAHAFFREENPDGVVCWAQAMYYNANHQDSPDDASDADEFQPRVGWDTLNWNSDGPDSQAFEFEHTARRIPDPLILLDPIIFFPNMTIPYVGDGLDLPGVPFFPRLSEAEPEIRPNWQAKLVPVTKRKLGRALPAITISDPTLGKFMVERTGVGIPLIYSHDLSTH